MNSSKDELVKREILLQAQQLFQQFGSRKTTMDEIAEASGKAKSTLYHYFKSKEEVMEQVMEMDLTEMRKKVKEKVDEQPTLAKKIQTYIIEFQKASFAQANIYRVVRKQNNREPNAIKALKKMVDFEKSYLLQMMEDSYDSGECREFSKEDLPMVAELMLASTFGMIIYLLEVNVDYSQENFEKISEIFTHKMFAR